ncbi:MAG TPA: carboxypeptidase regulatory-like domain-containing protein, partial [Hellea balneolensis]|nr:carboxypeptidase regulatory-like domain-containing protein [Hellea balneolensis]
MTNKYKSFKTSLHYTSVLSGVILATSLTLMSAPAMAQGQTGSISGYATTADGTALAGVRIEATSPYLPRPRITTTGSNGRYQLPLLPPGNYTLKFRAPDGTTTERSAKVLLQQKIKVNVTLGQKIDQVVARGTRIRVDSGHASLKDSLGTDAIEGVPVGQDYRDLLKLIPGVQYTEDTVRGPSAGGHGQDNIYQF